MTLRELIGQRLTLTNGKALCPFHTEKTASFHVHPTKNFYKCFGCGASGDAVRWLTDMGGVPFKEAVKKAADMGLPRQERLRATAPPRPQRSARDEGLSATAKYGLRIWQEASPFEDTPAEWYLRGRAIWCAWDSVRFHPGIPKDKGGSPLPAMLVLVTDRQGQPTGVQATFLRQAKDGAWVKSDRKDSRRTYGAIAGKDASAKFGRVEHGVMAVAEGSETAMAAAVLQMVPAEATLGIGNLNTWTPPEGVKTIYLCGEGDHRDAWIKAGERLSADGFKVAVSCGDGKDDANDKLRFLFRDNLPPAIHDLTPMALYDDAPPDAVQDESHFQTESTLIPPAPPMDDSPPLYAPASQWERWWFTGAPA